MIIKLMPVHKPSRIAIRHAVDEVANIMPVIAYEISKEEREAITEGIYQKLNLTEV